MSKVVLDASALLALLNEEPGAEKVAQVLPRAIMSAVNMSECAAVLNQIGVPAREVRTILGDVMPHLEVFDAEQAFMAGHLRLMTREYGLSFGDRACLALAKIKKLPVLTADKAWQKLACGVQVDVIR